MNHQNAFGRLSSIYAMVACIHLPIFHVLARPAITLAQILYDPSAMWPTGWLPPSPPPPQQVPQGNQPPPPQQQQQQQGIPNNPYAANNGGAAAAGGGHHPLFGLGQQGFYGYGGAPTLNPAQTTMTEQEAYRQILMALEQNKQQALQQLVQACTGGALYPPQYPLYNYSAAATPSPNARETWPRTQPHNPFAYFSRDHQNVQGTPNTQEIPPTNTRSVPSPNVPPDVMNVSQVFSSYTDGGSAHGSDYQRFQKDSHSERQGTSSSKLPQQRTNSTNEETYQHENEDSVMSGIDSIIAFQERQLRKITNGYSNFLGNGAFGEVYLGTLHDGQKVAVKVPIRATETCITDLKNELRIQSRIKHRNVVKLLGYCLDGDAPKLVYEFAPNGNLYEKLHGRNKIPMPLDVRLRIALECAEGLAYIHSSTETCILHGDVKSANILLDDNLGAKVSDFGLSRLLSVSSNTMYTSNVRGSFGYIDPMFMAKGVLTQKSDVYSFGVVLVELITRRKARDEFGNDLASCFQSCFSKGNMLEQDMVDKEIATRSDKDLVEGIANIAFQCLNANVKERPEMKKVAYRLAWLLEHRHGGGSLIRSSLNHHN